MVKTWQFLVTVSTYPLTALFSQDPAGLKVFLPSPCLSLWPGGAGPWLLTSLYVRLMGGLPRICPALALGGLTFVSLLAGGSSFQLCSSVESIWVPGRWREYHNTVWSTCVFQRLAAI
jgi:hypothetical protein